MFVTANQFYVLLFCISFGLCLGIIYSLVMLLKKVLRLYPLKVMADIIFFVFSSICYVFISFKYNFPSLRFYMIAGVFVGIVGYIKSFNIILAKLAKKVYNIIIKKRRKKFDERREI